MIDAEAQLQDYKIDHFYARRLITGRGNKVIVKGRYCYDYNPYRGTCFAMPDTHLIVGKTRKGYYILVSIQRIGNIRGFITWLENAYAKFKLERSELERELDLFIEAFLGNTDILILDDDTVDLRNLDDEELNKIKEEIKTYILSSI